MKLIQRIQLKQIQTLRQALSPKLIQSLKTMQMGYQDLVNHITTEAKDNIFLELTPPQHYSPSVRSNSTASSDDLSFLDFTSQYDHAGNIIDYVNAQLKLEHLSEKDAAIATDITDHLDPRGYLPNYDHIRQTLAKKHDVQERKINDILKIVQDMEPDGVGARSLKECLIIQINHYQFDTEDLQELLTQLVAHHLDALGNKKYKEIATALDIDTEDVLAMHAFIKQNLTPNPGAMFSTTPTHTNSHITPSFKVYINDHSQIIIENLEEKNGPKLNLRHQEDILNDPKLDEESRAFLKEKYQKAKDLLDQFQNRLQNLNTLITTLIRHQELFVKNGLIYLEPLLQKTLATTLNLSYSTVSRIISSKFIETPHGIFPLKQLCPRNISGKTAARLTLIIQDIASQHPQDSDEKLRLKLQKIGVHIARRTVAKYRYATQTKASYQRDPQHKSP